MCVTDESSIGHQRHQITQDIFFVHVPPYAPIWRRPYPWMNVGNLCPGVNKKPPPTKFDVRRKAVKGLCTWSDHASSAVRSARSPGVRRNNFLSSLSKQGPHCPVTSSAFLSVGNTAVPHMSTPALMLRPCYSQPGHRLC